MPDEKYLDKKAWEGILRKAGGGVSQPIKFDPLPYHQYQQMTEAKAKAAMSAQLANSLGEKAKMNAEEPVYTQLTDDKVAMMGRIPNMCPECHDECYIEFLSDNMRVKIRHQSHRTCSRSNTDVIRPLAQFIVFI